MSVTGEDTETEGNTSISVRDVLVNPSNKVYNKIMIPQISFYFVLFIGRRADTLIQEELDYLKKRLMSERVTERELRDVNLEFTRLNLQLEFCLLSHDVTSLNLTLDEPSTHVMRDVRDNLSSGKLIEAKRLDELLKKLAAIR